VLTLLHTSDWRLGRPFARFAPEAAPRLDAARLTAVENVLALAAEVDAAAVVCVGDLFDSPHPAPALRQAVLERLGALKWKDRPVFLVPGDRDPALEGSVWTDADFRAALPAFVHVVTEPRTVRVRDELTLHLFPATTRVGVREVTATPEGEGPQVGVVHRARLLSREALAAAGLDAWCLGGEPAQGFAWDDRALVHSGTPEPMDFAPGEGRVALLRFGAKGKLLVEPRESAVLRWEEVMVGSLASLRQLGQRKDLGSRVLRVVVNARVALSEHAAFQQELDDLEEDEALVMELDTRQLSLEVRGLETGDGPAALALAGKRLAERDEPAARRALAMLAGEG